MVGNKWAMRYVAFVFLLVIATFATLYLVPPETKTYVMLGILFLMENCLLVIVMPPWSRYNQRIKFTFIILEIYTLGFYAWFGAFTQGFSQRSPELNTWAIVFVLISLGWIVYPLTIARKYSKDNEEETK